MKRKNVNYLLLAVFVLLLATGSGAEAKGIFGGTDLINTPTNRALAQGGYTLGAHIDEHGHGRIQLDFGLVPEFELGAALDLGKDYHDLSARFKYRLIPETKDNFGLALGIQDIGKEHFSPYVVIGHVLSPYNLRWNFGLGGGQLGGIFFGMSKVLNPSEFPQVTLTGEYDASGLNLGAKINLNKGLLLNVGVLDMDHFVVGLTLSN